jgi:DNA-binding NtrC family response regulator
MTLVLIVDDVPAMAEQYAYDLKRLRGYETLIAKSGRTALESLTRDSIDCVILDLEMPGMDGFEVLRSVERLGLRVPIIVYTGTGDYDRCAQAIRLGAYSFIDKAEPMERVAQEVENAIERRRLNAEVTSLRRGFGLETPLVGTSPAIAKLKEAIVRVAPVPSAVLIVGESGTGKELVARELHRLGANPKGPFVALNSAALPHELVESELFGHERGAFTGATATRKGAFEAASGGTLFLDEIGDLPANAQAKMLRVLEERKVTRIGANKTIDVNARVVAATHRELEKEVAEGRFREDLLFRLNTIEINLPPLRDRREDIPALAAHFLRRHATRYHKALSGFDAGGMQALLAHSWPGNIRELDHAVERSVLMAAGDQVRASDLGLRAGASASGGAPRLDELPLEEVEKMLIQKALSRYDGNVSRAAQALGLSRSALYRRIASHGL